MNDIVDFGEERYLKFISQFCAVPTDYRVCLYDIGYDCDEMSDFSLFMIMYRFMETTESRILFGDLDLTRFIPKINPQNSELILHDPERNIVIDEATYLQMTQYVRAINRMERPKQVAGNEATKMFLIEDERLAAQILAKDPKPFQSIYAPLISSLANSPGVKYNYSEIMTLPVYTFNDAVMRTQNILNYNHLMSGIYAGTVDSNKIQNKELLNWMSRL